MTKFEEIQERLVDLNPKALFADGFPFEHVARPATFDDARNATGSARAGLRVAADQIWFGNFRGWVQLRKLIPNEADILAPRVLEPGPGAAAALAKAALRFNFQWVKTK